jgi:hypothetical protein
MLATLIRKELLSNLLTMRLAVALAFTVLLTVLTAFIGSLEYSHNWDRFESERQKYEQKISEATVWNQLEPILYIPPQPLSILSRGLSDGAGSQFQAGMHWMWVTPDAVTAADTDLMHSLVRIDFTTIVAILLSFLAIVLGYDAICGERERGTLQLLLANSVPRSTVVLGKLIGGLLSIWIPLALAFVVALLILLANPDVAFSSDDWLRLGLLFVISCLFIGQVFTLSLAVSAFTRDSATSLIICLFFWLIAGVGVLNVAPSLARYGVDEPPWFEFMQQNNDLWTQYNEIIDKWVEQNPRPDDVFFKGLQAEGRMRYHHPRAYEWQARRNGFALEKRLEASSKRYKMLEANQMPLAREALLVDEWSVLSPMVTYQVLSYRLARTTLSDNLYLAKNARRWRNDYYEWLRGKGVLGDRSFFTDDPLHQEPLIPDPESLSPEELAPDSDYMRERMAWMKQQEERRKTSPVGLDLTDLPKVSGNLQRDLRASMAEMVPGLVVLLLSFGVCVLLVMTRFLTYDPGR